MAIYSDDFVDIDLASGTGLHRSFLQKSIGKGDAMKNRFGVRLFRNGEPVNLGSCSVEGFFIPPIGDPILLSGNNYTGHDGNEAWVRLAQACYNYEGQFTLAIKVIDSVTVGTMRIVDGTVNNTGTTGAVAPTASVPTYQEILAVYDEMLAAKDGSVRFDITQELTNAQKASARQNIEAESTEDAEQLKGITEGIGQGVLRWESGTFSGHGLPIDSTVRIRSKTIITAADRLLLVKIETGYEWNAFEYDEDFGYIGAQLNFISFPISYLPLDDDTAYVRLVVKRTDDAAIDPSEGGNVLIATAGGLKDLAVVKAVEFEASGTTDWINGTLSPNEIVVTSTTRINTPYFFAAIRNRVRYVCNDGYMFNYCEYDDLKLPGVVHRTWISGSGEITVTKPYIRFIVKRSDDEDITVAESSNVRISFVDEGSATGGTEWLGKRISFLGDSITTYAGDNAQTDTDGHLIADGTWTYLGNHCRYPQSNLLTNVNNCYWKILIDTLGMLYGVNESWAGSKVSWNGSATGSDDNANVCISSQTRINHLGGNGTPDIILVNAGTNDIIQSVTVGTFNTDSPRSYTDEQIAALSVETFADAYRAMLIRLQKTYQTAEIVCMLPNFTSDTYYNPKKQDPYLEVIKEACDYFGVKWIDARAVGVTMFNLSTYLGDGVHPNADGMQKLADDLLKKFLYDIAL